MQRQHGVTVNRENPVVLCAPPKYLILNLIALSHKILGLINAFVNGPLVEETGAKLDPGVSPSDVSMSYADTQSSTRNCTVALHVPWSIVT